MSVGLNGDTADPWTGSPPSGRSIGEEFVVKIQLPVCSNGSPVLSGKLLVYDKTRTMLFYFDADECERLEELASKICCHGHCFFFLPNGRVCLQMPLENQGAAAASRPRLAFVIHKRI